MVGLAAKWPGTGRCFKSVVSAFIYAVSNPKTCLPIRVFWQMPVLLKDLLEKK
jgi:hypothetical protein